MTPSNDGATMDGPATVAACQLDVADLEVERNVSAVAGRVAALAKDVDVALFPEYALTGFVADERVEDVALETDGPELDRLRAVAAEADTAILVGYVEAAGAGLYNASAYVRPEGEVTVYRKRHRWGGEAAVLDPGDERVVLETPAGRTGLLTCYDLNFVHDSAVLVDDGVDALFVVGAWPAAHAANWRLLCRARALDGVRYCVAAGRTGRRGLEDARTVTYAGRSLAVRPDGSVMAALNRAERDIVVTLDPEELAEQRSLVGAVDADGRPTELPNSKK